MRTFEEIYEYAKKGAPDAKEDELKAYVHHVQIEEFWDDIILDPDTPDDLAEIAKGFKFNRLDISQKEDLDCYRFKIEGTFGANDKYESCDFVIRDKTKENGINFLKEFKNILSSGVDVYSFSNVKTGGDTISKYTENTLKGKGYSGISIEEDEPLPLRRVKKPNGFKSFTYKLFGWFKKEHDDYTKYEDNVRKYNETVSGIRKRNAARMAVKEGMSDVIEKNKSYDKTVRAVVGKILDNKTIEQKLEDAANLEKKKSKGRDLAAGRIRELLDRQKNYQDLCDIPLEKNENLPVEGLAILVSTSRSANEQVHDASSTGGTMDVDESKLTPEEKEQYKELKTILNDEDNSSKMYQTYFTGGDVKRMGSRALGIVKSRRILNEAIKEYGQGNKEPLANLVNESWPSLYSVCMTTTNLDGGEGMAETEAAKGLLDLISKDPEMRRMINISDEKLNKFEGFIKLQQVFEKPAEKELNDYRKDNGPNSDSRREAIEDELFRAALIKNYKAEMEKISTINQKMGTDFAEGRGPYKKEFLDKIQTGATGNYFVMISKAALLNDKQPDILHEFRKNNFDISSFKEQVMKPIRETEAYKKMLSMDKDELYAYGVKKEIKDDLFNEIDKKLNSPEAGKKVEKVIETGSKNIVVGKQ